MKKFKNYILSICLLLPISLFSSCTKNDGLTHITIAEVTHSLFYAPQYIAINKGFFEEEGLKVKIITTPGADKTMGALLSKEVQIGLMGPEASVYVYNKHEKNYAINFAQLTQKDGSFLLGREKIENFSFDMLKGKTIIGGRKGGMPEMTLEYVLKKAGLDIGQNDQTKEVNIRTDVNFDVMAGVFVAGQSDFVTLFEPAASQVELNNVGHIVASIGEASGEVPYTCYSATKNYIKSNRSILTKFTRAIKKGLNYIYEQPLKEIVKALQSSFISSSFEEIAKVIHNYLRINAWPSTLKLSQESFARLLEIVTLAGELENSAPFDKLVDNSFVSDL